MKTNMNGLNEQYKKIMDHVRAINEITYGMGYGFDDAPYHGWTGESLKREIEILKSVTDKVVELKDVLNSVIVD